MFTKYSTKNLTTLININTFNTFYTKYFSTTTTNSINTLNTFAVVKNFLKNDFEKNKLVTKNNNILNQVPTMPINFLRLEKTNFFRYYTYRRNPMKFRFYKYNIRFYLLTLLKPRLYKRAKDMFRFRLYSSKRILKNFHYNQIKMMHKITLFNLILENNLKKKNNKQKKIGLSNIVNKLKMLKKEVSIITSNNKPKVVNVLSLLKQYKNIIKQKNTLKNLVLKYETLENNYNVKKLYYMRRFNKLISLNKNPYSFMRHLKFYTTRNTFYKFRYFKFPFYKFKKKIKWAAKKRLKLSLKRKVFIKSRTYNYMKKRYPYRIRKMVRAYTYKRFSYYWLRYFFKCFSTMYINQSNNLHDYNVIKHYLSIWLYKVRQFNFLSLYSLNKARGFLLHKTNHLFSKYKKYRLFNYPRLTYTADRNDLDDMLRRMVKKKRFMYKNFYWRYYKSALERRKLNVLRKDYRFTWNFYPYIFIRKKYKMFYNWADRHVYKRYPLYRYKYTLTYKFPRFADYRRLFKNQLREQHVFRYLYRLKLGQLIKAFRKSTANTKRSFELMFLKHFELRLDTVIYRLNFAYSLKHARQLVLRGLFVVNNKVIDNPKYHVTLGDVIMPIKRLRMQPLSKKYLNYVDYGLTLTWNRLFYRPIQSDQYPSHFLLNERIPAGMIMTNVNPYKLRYTKPFSLQFLTLSLLKYN